MPDPYSNPTAREFLAARARWLKVAPVVTTDGVHAVAVVIDGYYTDYDRAQAVADHLRDLLADVLRHEGIPAPVIDARAP